MSEFPKIQSVERKHIRQEFGGGEVVQVKFPEKEKAELLMFGGFLKFGDNEVISGDERIAVVSIIDTKSPQAGRELYVPESYISKAPPSEESLARTQEFHLDLDKTVEFKLPKDIADMAGLQVELEVPPEFMKDWDITRVFKEGNEVMVEISNVKQLPLREFVERVRSLSKASE